MISFPRGKNELAYAFLERILSVGSRVRGAVAVVLPQNFLYMYRYTTFREWLLGELQWKLIARLGARAFETISGEVVNAGLIHSWELTDLSKTLRSKGMIYQPT